MNILKRTLSAVLLCIGLAGAFHAAGAASRAGGVLATGNAAAGATDAGGITESTGSAAGTGTATATGVAGTTGAGSAGASQNPEAPRAFRLPDIPAVLTTPEERASYLSLHYWDHFDFADTTLIARPEITEQAFVDFISILPYTPKAQAAVDSLIGRTLTNKEMFYHFVSLADKYLYEPNSPMYDEALHILVLRAVADNPRVEEIDKLRPRRLLALALRNRPGDIASDFAVTCRDGSRRRLSQIKAEYVLLYFHDPECEECRRMKEQLAASSTVNRLLASGRLALLSVCVEGKTTAWEAATYPAHWIDGCDAGQRLTRDEVYDLKAMPTLYLLDAEKRVLLKDAPIERIEARLSEK